jgi:hypothetical protein
MNKKEIRKEIISEGMYDIDDSTFVYTSQEIDLIVGKLEAKINYTRCCEMLKVEEKLTFSKWLEANKYEYRHNNLYRQEGNKLLTHVDLLGKEYIKYFNL